MFIEMIILILLRKLIKSDKAFTITIMSIMLIALILKFFTPLYSWGYVRGASSIPMGIFLASLPKIKNKWVVIPSLAVTIAACFAIICYGWADVTWGGYKIPELILDNALYPALIYLTFCLRLESKALSYLGGLSFGLYAFQCTADMVRNTGVNKTWVLFAIILTLTLIEDSGKRIYRCLRARRA